MKNIIFLIAFSLPVIAFAQVEKGRSFVSANLSFSHEDGDEINKRSTFGMSGTYGYLVGDAWAVGVKPSYDYYHVVQTTVKSYTHRFDAGPFVRRYFSISEKLFLQVDGGASAGFWRTRSEYDDGSTPTSKSNIVDIYLTPGATYFVSEKIALQATLGSISFSKTRNTAINNNASETANSWSFNTNLNIRYFQFGAAIYF